MRKEIWRTAAGPPQAKDSATCNSSFTQKILVMKPESFSGILKERLLHPVLVEPADECDVRFQLNSREKTEKKRKQVGGTISKPSGLEGDNKETERKTFEEVSKRRKKKDRRDETTLTPPCGLRPVVDVAKRKYFVHFASAVGPRDGSCNPRMSATCAPSLTEKIAMHNYRNTSDAAKGRGSRERNRWPGVKNAATSRRSSRRKDVDGVCGDGAGGGVGQSVCLPVGLSVFLYAQTQRPARG